MALVEHDDLGNMQCLACKRIGPPSMRDVHLCPKERRPEGFESGREYERKLFVRFLKSLEGTPDVEDLKKMALGVKSGLYDPDSQTSTPEEWEKIQAHAKHLVKGS